MQIRCRNCRAILTVPESAAGTMGRCSNCSAELQIPRAGSPSPLPVNEEDGFEDYASYPGPGVRSTNRERLCPVCGQVLSRRSARCPTCDQDLDVPAPSRKRKKRKPTKHEILASRSVLEAVGVSGKEWLLLLLCPVIGLGVGVFYLLTGTEPEKGWKWVAISLGLIAVAFVIWAVKMSVSSG